MPTTLPSLMLAAALCGPAPESPLPPVHFDDLVRFPTHQLATDMDDAACRHLVFLRGCIWRLEQQWPGLGYLHKCDIEAELAYRRAELQEAEELRQCWCWLWQAHGGYTKDCPSRYGSVAPCAEAERRESLRLLRAKIGERAYLNGSMPPPLPVWRLRRLDW